MRPIQHIEQALSQKSALNILTIATVPPFDRALITQDGLFFSCAVNRRSLLRHSGHPHALMDALAPSTEGRIITHSASHAANGESWVEREPCPYRSPRFLQRAEQRKCGGKQEMREGTISVGFEAPA
jgi:hypothetical protein